ncbi:MAG: (d)CMP kinase [Candidatus Neomarinimicrobiota bacterium]|uniref:(d)CMP kinase n=1 Tax=marine metagenome TaxID=408172 RepID=A0A381RE35_9ZZZZ|nr:(d)CMP kinase [Candidatus Neomarinimicrobiota bacterium]MED5554293.1 (d)CMP kinase [Candidatus Neomarinimicrobiota bacterium]|tara:strand:- start:89 stop:751 length:663 start_codon:yes stop_codon:yes gene_type:complete
MIIAIDGPAASGKSTTAIGVAKCLGITYLDTGAMYRAVTFGLIENDIKFEDSSELDNYLKQIKLKLSETKSGVILNLDGRNISKEIRSSKVTENVSEVSALKSVRDSMVLIQRKMAKKNDCILEGRDIGTVVFPDADFKFFLIADENVRAKRRQNDLKKMGEQKSIDNVTRDIIKRDYKDSTRKHSPLIKSENAIIIDTSNLDINKVIDKIVNIVNKKGH